VRSLASLAAVLLVLALGCAGPRDARRYAPLPGGLSDDAARAALGRFAAAAEAGRWEEAYALLSTRWRAVYTPRRLAFDFTGGGPAARDAARAAAAAVAATRRVDREGSKAVIRVGPGRAAALLAEEGAWRVDALE
jgi:hypothetical protein